MAQPGAGIAARLFDGRSSRATRVRLSADLGALSIEAEGGGTPERLRPGDLHWHEPLGAAVRRVDLPGGRFCEVPPGPELDRLLLDLGHREAEITRWQASIARALLALFALLAVCLAAYRWGLPLAAEAVARSMPPRILRTMDEQFLTALDQAHVLAPSKLDAQSQAAVRDALAPILAARKEDLPLHLSFHASPIGANAFALPGGSIVVTDDLVALAPEPAHVAAVIAHELGHVAGRHGLRNIIQASAMATAIGLWTGDMSSLATGGATLLLSATYSRDFEREADAYGALLLVRAGRSPALLADMLERLEATTARGDGKEAGAAPPADAPAHDLGRYLSTHPPSAERIARLRSFRSGATE
jgi:Zn-dependent protease with chaperone function